jgi:hypothetical protein
VLPLFLFFPAKIVFSVSANSFLSSFSHNTEALLKETQQKRQRTTKQQKEQPHSEQHLNKNYFSNALLYYSHASSNGKSGV